MTRVYKSFFIVAAMILILASAGCAELPPEGESGWSGLFSPSESQETAGVPTPDPGYLTPATPYPTPTKGAAGPTLSTLPAVTPTPDPYVTIYNQTTQFNLTRTTEAYSFDLTRPPLIIEFRVEPKMITREKYATSDHTNIKSGMVKQTFPSETSWFTVTVRDRESGKIVAEDGFGKLYSADTRKRVFVGERGDYLIELSGNDAKVHVLMRAGAV
jgi:hypothetical protein